MDASFDEIYARHGVAVHGYLSRLVGNAAVAEELLQETFLRYLRHERSLVVLNGSLGGWLFRVATHLAIDHLRRRSGQSLQQEPCAAEPASSDIEECLRIELDRLPAELRGAFLLRAHHDLSFQQVGDALGISERAAKARFRKTRDILARRLGPRIQED